MTESSDFPAHDGVRGFSARELQGAVFEPVRFILEPYIPASGLTVLAAKPKFGKSWFMLQAAIAVALGAAALGDAVCPQGDVLFAALEDNPRRLQDRMRKLYLGDDAWPDRLAFWIEMRRLDEGGLDQLHNFIRLVPTVRLIIIDTWAMARGNRNTGEQLYDIDYRQAAELKAFADEHGIAIVIIHHLRKMDADDPLDAVSGSNGLTAAADTILVMRRETAGAVLHARGRDIEDVEHAIEFDREACRWTVLGDAGEVHRSDARTQILDVLRVEGPLTPAQITKMTGTSHAAVRQLVTRMAQAGELKHGKGAKYSIA
jgi:hypothetical protein